jgi:hypothetical protein
MDSLYQRLDIGLIDLPFFIRVDSWIAILWFGVSLF